MSAEQGPLAGVTVLDLTRMLPGAVNARQLVDLSARLIKVEDPIGGDPLRHPPPHVDGVSTAFTTLLRGAESVCLALNDPGDARSLRRLVRNADVLVESFRPGTMEGWDLAPERLQALNPGLIWCSISAYGRNQAGAGRIAHDLNVTAESGLLSALSGGIPRLQLADVTAGLLASSAILAALLQRQRTGRGTLIDQPLVTGPLPFLSTLWAEAAAGGGCSELSLGLLLSGACPCYRLYVCQDGLSVAVAAIEPKLWSELVHHLGLARHAGAGLDTGTDGELAAIELEQVFATQPRSHWLTLAADEALPISPVNDIAKAQQDPFFAEAGLVESTPLAGGMTLSSLGPFLPSLGQTPSQPAPHLGEHTEAVLKEHGLL
jgi:crotonobetainyl-CoA:carnitine CoA-transferase CaiB-like acyl-CoA transferase